MPSCVPGSAGPTTSHDMPTIGGGLRTCAGKDTWQYAVPPGTFGGQPLAVNTPSGPMQVTIPPGLNEGDSFQVVVPSCIGRYGIVRVVS